MAREHLEKLARLGGAALGALPSEIAEDLRALLAIKNGFYAFESALHVFPLEAIAAWNAPESWRADYGDLTDGLVFFAEDIFGGQFALGGNRVWSFDPETGDRKEIACDLEGWAGAILADYRVLTGHPLANAWQRKHGRLPNGKRLVPKRPFVVGGKFEIDNLAALDAVAGMRSRGALARQIRTLPDGAQIELRVVR